MKDRPDTDTVSVINFTIIIVKNVTNQRRPRIPPSHPEKKRRDEVAAPPHRLRPRRWRRHYGHAQNARPRLGKIFSKKISHIASARKASCEKFSGEKYCHRGSPVNVMAVIGIIPQLGLCLLFFEE